MNSTHYSDSTQKKIPRFHRLDTVNIKALESTFSEYPFLQGRVEIHLPFNKTKSSFQNDKIWVWAKFDRRPATYLVFQEGQPACIWDPSRQEGMTLRWLLPPGFCSKGPTICLANLLAGESTIQIEDLLVSEGQDLWSNFKFSERWEKLRNLWSKMPADQPLLAVTPRIVKPFSLQEWQENYDASLSWIFQPDVARSPRWYWWDAVTKIEKKTYIPPTLARKPEILTLICALCKPYTKLGLPDTSMLECQEGRTIGIAGITTLDLSKTLRSEMKPEGVPVEVKWNDEFEKYQIVRLLPTGSPISTESFFSRSLVGNG
jgi:hypothetical protein